MLERPFDSIVKGIYNNLDKSFENHKQNFSSSEKFMDLIIGFAIGGLSIIISNLSSLDKRFSYCTIKFILCLLSFTIIFGIVYRVFFYAYKIHFQSAEFYLKAAFSKNNSYAIEPRDLSNESDINKILEFFKLDFDKDYPNYLNDYQNSNEETRVLLIKDLKDHYLHLCIFYKNEYNFAIKYIKDTYIDAFGIKEKEINKLFNKSHNPKKIRIYGILTGVSFFISLISFILVVLILATGY